MLIIKLLFENLINSLKLNSKNKPFMKNQEIFLLKALLLNIKPKNCLEWGSGYSTVYFSDFIPRGSKWLAIEHSLKWSKKVKKMIDNSKVEIKFIPPNNSSWSNENDDGLYKNFVDYVEYPKVKAPFDFILIDGRSRSACIKKALNFVSDQGVVVLHDANREFYHKNLNIFPNQIFFLIPGKEDKGLWIGTKKIKIESILNIENHKKIARLHNFFRRIRKFN